MNRRRFNTGLMGGAVAAAMPLPVVAKAATRPATGPLYAWAVAIARAQNRASPALLAKQLHISGAAASQLYASMIADGVIKAPLFGGMARAAKPLFKGGRVTISQTQLSRPAGTVLQDAKQALERFSQEDVAAPEQGEDQAT